MKAKIDLKRRNSNGLVWKKCDKCKGHTKHLYGKDQDYCWHCHTSRVHAMPQFGFRLSLQQALEKEYNVHVYVGGGYPKAQLSVPIALGGRRVKLVLVEDSK